MSSVVARNSEYIDWRMQKDGEQTGLTKEEISGCSQKRKWSWSNGGRCRRQQRKISKDNLLCWGRSRTRSQALKLPLPNQILHPFRGNTKVFPSQLRDIISLACHVSTQRAFSWWDMSKTTPGRQPQKTLCANDWTTSPGGPATLLAASLKWLIYSHYP